MKAAETEAPSRIAQRPRPRVSRAVAPRLVQGRAGDDQSTTSAPLLVISLPDLAIRSANSAAAELFGTSIGQLTNASFGQLFAEPDPLKTAHAMTSLASGAIEAFRSSKRFLVPTGAIEAAVWVRAIPRSSGTWAVVTILPFSSDSEAASFERASLGPLAVDLAVGTMDNNGLVRVASISNTQVFSFVGGQPSAGWQIDHQIHPDDRPTLRRALGRLIHDRDDAVVKVRVFHETRGWIAAECHMFPMGALTDPTIGFILAEAIDSVDGRPPADLSELTLRQRDIVNRLLDGSRVQSIANSLFLSPSTVRNHLSCVYRLLDVHSQSELIDLLRPAV